MVLVFGLSREATAQVLPCGLLPTDSTSVKTREQKILLLKQQLFKARVQTGISYIPIKAHIIRQSNGSGGLSLADLNKALVQTNSFYINSNIQFYLCGSSPHYIDNSTYYDLDNSEENALCSANDVNNAINVYFANSISFGSLLVAGYAYFPGNSNTTNRIFIQSSSASDSRTMPHELGHYFNLYHTFQGSTSTPISDRELVTRSYSSGANCQTMGDLLCDTPSDPYGRSQDSTQVIGCNYVGNAKDAHGQLFSPSLSNIMSYYPVSCGNIFTGGQYARIADGLILRTDPTNQYTLNCGSTVTGTNVPSGLTGTINSLGLNLSFVDNSSNETGFIIERSITSSTSGFIPIAGLAPNVTTFTDQSISAFTTYYYRVKASNSSTDYSPVFQITTTLNYCLPQYANACSSIPVVIDDFILRDASNTNIINNIDSNCSPNNYGDFTSTSYNVEVGKTYNFIARAISGGIGTYYDQHLTIWLDYNRDGVFTTSEMVYKSTSVASTRMTPTATGSFTIPSISSGIVRMRLRSGFGSFAPVVDSCNSLPFGEAEDYHLNVTAAIPTISAATIIPTSACAGENISVSFTTTIPVGSGNYVVQLSDNTGNNFTSIPTFGSNSPLSASIPASTPAGNGYKIRVISTSPSVTGLPSSTFSINTTPTPPTVTSPVNYQQNQSASPLAATGSNLLWYSSLTGGTGSSSTPTPPTSTIGTTYYYVSQSVANCESTRATIQVNVTAVSATISTSTVLPSSACIGQNISVAFTTTIPNGSNTYTVQLSDNTGNNFTNIPTSGTASPLTATIPISTVAGSGYKVRVISTNPNVTGSTSNSFDINATPTPPTVTSPVNYQQNQTASPLAATGSSLLWYADLTGGTGSSSTPTPSTTAIGTSYYYVSQSVTNCESARATIQVNVTAVIQTISTSTTLPSSVCAGQNVSVSFTTTIPSGSGTYTVQLSDNTGNNFTNIPTSGTVSPLTATIPASTVAGGGYKVRVVSTSPSVIGSASNSFTINTTPTPPTVTSPVNYQQNQSASPLVANGSNLLWYSSLTGGTGSSSTPTPSTSTVGTTYYYVSQSVTNCESARATIQVNVSATSLITACLNIKVFLEGAYSSSNNQMTTLLNSQGILPGQTPINPFANGVPAGQPYYISPWNYNGSENIINYNSTVVDWVLISLRTNAEDKSTTVYKAAALLNSNGTVTTIGACPNLSSAQQYYVGIDHRNHVGAISHQALPIINNSITYDFTTQDSYIPSFPPAYGQKLVGSTYCLIAGDCLKNAVQEINVIDVNKWRLDNGKFSQYIFTDMNMDGETNALDVLIWRKNNGKYSGIEF